MQHFEHVMRVDYRRINAMRAMERPPMPSYLFDTCKCMRAWMHRMKYLFAERRRGNPYRSVSRSGTRDHLDNRSGGTVIGVAGSGPGTGCDDR